MTTFETGIIGVGLPVVDRMGVVREVPSTELLDDFLQHSSELPDQCGGVVPNILSNLIALSPTSIWARFLGSVGDDKEGEMYRKTLDTRLGKLQVQDEVYTARLFDLETTSDKRVWKFFLGAAGELSIAEHVRAFDRQKNTALLVDFNTLRTEDLYQACRDAMFNTRDQGGYLLLNLAGVQGISKERVSQVLDTIVMPITMVVGNEDEFNVLEKFALQDFLRDSEVVVETQGHKGSVLRAYGHEIDLDPVPLDKDSFRNSIGCGDSYMGAFLSVLFQEKPEFWSLKLLQEAGLFAGYVAAQTAASSEHRLKTKELEWLRASYFNH